MAKLVDEYVYVNIVKGGKVLAQMRGDTYDSPDGWELLYAASGGRRRRVGRFLDLANEFYDAEARHAQAAWPTWESE